MKKLLFILFIAMSAIAHAQPYTANLYWYGYYDDCIPVCTPPGTLDFWQSNLNICNSTGTASQQFTVKGEVYVNHCALPNPYQYVVTIYRNGAYYTQQSTIASSNWFAMNFTLTQSGTYYAVIDFKVKQISNCFIYQTVYSVGTNSIVFSINQNITNNWNLTYPGNSITAQTTPTTCYAMCASQTGNLVINSSGRSGTITNYFVEVAETDMYQNYTGGQYFSNWYSSLSTTANLSSLLPGGFLQANKFYKIKLALQGPCASWIEKSAFILTSSACKTDGDENDVQLSTIHAPGLQLFPNPATDNLTIDLTMERASPAHFKLYDLSGKVVMNYELGSAGDTHISANIQIGNLPGGAYFYQVIADKVYTGKVLKL